MRSLRGAADAGKSIRWAGLAGGLALLALLSWALPAQAVTFRWSNDGDAVAMEPYFFNETFSLGFMSNVYDPFVIRDKELKIAPSLAESWKRIDPLTWEFQLRKGVKFHDGTPFTSADVVFSYNRVTSAGSDLKANFISIASVEATGPYTAVIKTKVPNPILLSYLTTWEIMSKKWCEDNKAVDVADIRKGQENFAIRHANGTGAFMLVSREADVKTVLKRNPDWWGWKTGLGTSNVDEVVFTPIKQDATRVAALLSGDVDMIYSLPIQDAGRVKANGDKVYQQPETRTVFLGLDQKRDELLESDVKGKNPFKDRRVRLALYQAIDENSIVRSIMKGAATPATDMVVPFVTGFDPDMKRYPYDPDAAKKLLAEAGYPNGFSIGFDCPNDRYVNDAEICQAVTAMWAKIGVKANLLAQTKSIFFAKILARKTSAFMLGWTPATLDTLDALDNLLYTNDASNSMGRFNLGSFNSPKLDSLADQARTEFNVEKRTRLLQEGLDEAQREVATIPLHYQVVVWASSAKVDLTQLSTNYFEWYWVEKK